jgi:uncharacterized protein (DUF1015 family)
LDTKYFFAQIDSLYIADGHHRSEAARFEEDPEDENKAHL